MAHTTHIETATIYQFPLNSRSSRRTQTVEATITTLERKSNRFADAAYGGSWYHEAAIEEEHSPKS